MDQAKFKITQRNHIRTAVLSAFVDATVGGAASAFVSLLLLRSWVCAAKNVLPQCARDRLVHVQSWFGLPRQEANALDVAPHAEVAATPDVHQPLAGPN